jgi:hypothetical protein
MTRFSQARIERTIKSLQRLGLQVASVELRPSGEAVIHVRDHTVEVAPDEFEVWEREHRSKLAVQWSLEAAERTRKLQERGREARLTIERNKAAGLTPSGRRPKSKA